MEESRICTLFGVEKPIVQAGMIWCSGWELASAVSNAGALGLIGSGSMYPEILRTHIRKCKEATSLPFGVNVPLLYADIDKQMKVIIEEGVKVVFTSAGNPKTWTGILKSHGITVVHVVSTVKFAQKSQDAGVDAIVAEGFEAGGHNGREETTTMVLIPQVVPAVEIPVMAAGGIGNGRQMAAAFALGAEGVQVGSRFVTTLESSAHTAFKQAVVDAKEGDTQVTLKQLTPVRMIRNKFFQTVNAAEKRGAGVDELATLLGRARAKKGMFEGDLDEGELEIGQVSALINEIKPAAAIVEEIYAEFKDTLEKLKRQKFG
jgi:enoyl-[acyl-carrier protein] reductase II